MSALSHRLFVATLTIWRLTLSFAAAAEPDASLLERLPAGGMATVEVTDLEPLLTQFQSSDGYRKWLASPVYQNWAREAKGRAFHAGVAFVENQLGSDVWTLAKSLLGKRWALALYPAAGKNPVDVVLLIETKDAAMVRQLQEKLKPLATVPGEKITSDDRPDGGWQLNLPDGASGVLHEQWIVFSNNPSLLELTMGMLKQAGEGTLANDPNFRRANLLMGTGQQLRAWVDLEWARQERGGRLFPAKADQPLASFLLGSLAELANQSHSAFVTTHIGDGEFQAAIGLAGDVTQLPDSHRGQLDPGNHPVALSVPKLDGLLGGVTLFRNAGLWYQHREALLDAKALEDLDRFETTFRAFVQNKDFGKNLLPALGNRWTFVAAPQSFAHLKGRPDPELPAFGLILDLAQPEAGAEVLTQLVQTIAMFNNLQAPSQAREPWVMTTETYRDVPMTLAAYVKLPEGDNLLPAYNFTPAMARVESRFVIATSPDLCRSLIDALKGDTPSAGKTESVDNLFLQFDPGVAAKLMKAEQSTVVERAVRAGKSLMQAQREFNWWLDVLRELKPLQLRTSVDSDAVRVKLTGGWK